jgi:hypothetical protein
MPFFNAAHGIRISGGQMNDVAGNVNNNTTIIKSHRVRSDNTNTSNANNNSSSGSALRLYLCLRNKLIFFTAVPVSNGVISN